MLGAAKPNAFRAECDCIRYLLGCIGVGADAKPAEFVRPLHQFRVLAINETLLGIERAIDQHLNNLGRRCCHFTGKNFAGRSVDGDVIALA